MFYLVNNCKYKGKYIEDKKRSTKAYIILLGGFITWECRICGVKSRLCEYSGSMIDMTVECPSCRSLLFSFDDTNPDEFKCFNPRCGMIKHKDLEKVRMKARMMGEIIFNGL